jgi:hypothetical protein
MPCARTYQLSFGSLALAYAAIGHEPMRILRRSK